MAEKKDHTLCVTCHTELPPDREIAYLGFGKELCKISGPFSGRAL